MLATTSLCQFILFRYSPDLCCFAISHVDHYTDSIHTCRSILSIPCKKVSLIDMETSNASRLFSPSWLAHPSSYCCCTPSEGLLFAWNNLPSSSVYFTAKGYHGVYVDATSQHSALYCHNYVIFYKVLKVRKVSTYYDNIEVPSCITAYAIYIIAAHFSLIFYPYSNG